MAYYGHLSQFFSVDHPRIAALWKKFRGFDGKQPAFLSWEVCTFGSVLSVARLLWILQAGMSPLAAQE